ncbi:MAG: hypothetical protein CMH83_13460 [Nocardioides sp.]|nr:hypothetical protein [Nocardioides sp.]
MIMLFQHFADLFIFLSQLLAQGFQLPIEVIQQRSLLILICILLALGLQAGTHKIGQGHFFGFGGLTDLLMKLVFYSYTDVFHIIP